MDCIVHGVTELDTPEQLSLSLSCFETFYFVLTMLTEPINNVAIVSGRQQKDSVIPIHVSSPIQWTWTWANSGRWWGTGKPGMLQSTRSRRVGLDLVTEQQQKTHIHSPPILPSHPGHHITLSSSMWGPPFLSLLVHPGLSVGETLGIRRRSWWRENGEGMSHKSPTCRSSASQPRLSAYRPTWLSWQRA